jgi:hypothetical protein
VRGGGLATLATLAANHTHGMPALPSSRRVAPRPTPTPANVVAASTANAGMPALHGMNGAAAECGGGGGGRACWLAWQAQLACLRGEPGRGSALFFLSPSLSLSLSCY